jgi:putative hydrolase of the HAD superfamily
MIKAVVFDVGGVLVSSPFQRILEFERLNDLGKDFFAKVIVQGKAFKQLEDGTLSRSEFVAAFNKECLLHGKAVDGEKWLSFLEAGFVPDNLFINTIQQLKDRGLVVGVMTNNWAGFSINNVLPSPPDVLIESYVVKSRKPSETIYLICQDELQKKLKAPLKPEEICFLDDIG